MANQFGPDVGRAMQQGQMIKGAKTRNAMMEMQRMDMEAEQMARPAKLEAEQQRAQRVNGLREKAMAGGGDAKKAYLQADPKNAPEIIKAIDSIDQYDKESMTLRAKEVEQMTGWALHAQTPEDAQKRWDLVRKKSSPEQRKSMPEKFNQKTVAEKYSQLRSLNDYLEIANSDGKLGVVKYGDEDILTKGGKEIERKSNAKPEITPAQKLAREKHVEALGQRDYKNLVNSVANLAGAEIGPNGQMIIFKQDQAKWNQAQTWAGEAMRKKEFTNPDEAALAGAMRFGLVSEDQLAKDPAKAPSRNEQQQYPNGTVIKNAAGDRMVMQNGEWVAQ